VEPESPEADDTKPADESKADKQTALQRRLDEIRAKAKAQGVDLDKPAPRAKTGEPVKQYRYSSSEGKRPLTPREQAARRRMPSVNCRSPKRHAKLQIAAGLIVLCLGKEWRKECKSNGGVDLVHSSGARLLLRRDYSSHDDRFSICPIECKLRSDDPLPGEITVNATRSPASIAADIENRLISKGLIEGHKAVAESRRQQRAEKVRERLDVLRVAKALGMHQIARERNWSRHRPETNRYESPKLCVSAGIDYQNHIDLEVTCADAETAEEVVKLLRMYARSQAAGRC
jgi:hypothetical protein